MIIYDQCNKKVISAYRLFNHSSDDVFSSFSFAVAPVRYAHLAASLVSLFKKFDEMSETSSSHGGVTGVGAPPVPELPKLHKNVCCSMFFV